MLKFLSIVMFFVLLLVVLLLGAQNTNIVEVNYLIASGEMTVSLLISICVLIGVLLASVPYSLYVLKLRFRLRRLK